MAYKFNLKANLILTKKFKTELSGYSAGDVDQYLDQILEDYKAYEDILERKQKTIDELRQLVSEKEEQINTFQMKLESTKSLLKKAEIANKTELINDIQNETKEQTNI